MEADSIDTLERPWLEKYLSIRTGSPAAALSPLLPATQPTPSLQGTGIEDAARFVAKELLQALQPGEIEALRSHFASNQTVPPEYDRKLIAKSARIVGRQFESAEMRKIRGVFVKMVKDAPSTGSSSSS